MQKQRATTAIVRGRARCTHPRMNPQTGFLSGRVRTTRCLRKPADDAAAGLPDMAEDASHSSALLLMRTKPATRRRKMDASFWSSCLRFQHHGTNRAYGAAPGSAKTATYPHHGTRCVQRFSPATNYAAGGHGLGANRNRG